MFLTWVLGLTAIAGASSDFLSALPLNDVFGLFPEYWNNPECMPMEVDDWEGLPVDAFTAASGMLVCKETIDYGAGKDGGGKDGGDSYGDSKDGTVDPESGPSVALVADSIGKWWTAEEGVGSPVHAHRSGQIRAPHGCTRKHINKLLDKLPLCDAYFEAVKYLARRHPTFTFFAADRALDSFRTTPLGVQKKILCKVLQLDHRMVSNDPSILNGSLYRAICECQGWTENGGGHVHNLNANPVVESNGRRLLVHSSPPKTPDGMVDEELHGERLRDRQPKLRNRLPATRRASSSQRPPSRRVKRPTSGPGRRIPMIKVKEEEY